MLQKTLIFFFSGVLLAFLLYGGIYLVVYFELYDPIKITPAVFKTEQPVDLAGKKIVSYATEKSQAIDTETTAIFLFRDMNYKLSQQEFETLQKLQNALKGKVKLYAVTTNPINKKTDFYKKNKDFLYYQADTTQLVTETVYLVGNGKKYFATKGYHDWFTKETKQFIQKLQP